MADSIFSGLLIHQCSISRRTLGVVNEFNLPSEVISVIASSVSCLIQMQKETFEINIRGKTEATNVLGFFEYARDILQDDIVLYSSEKYIVLAVDNAGGQGYHKEVYLKKLVG